MPKKAKVTPYPLRMEPEVKFKAENQAKKERRSLNAWLQIAVEEKLDRIEGEAA